MTWIEYAAAAFGIASVYLSARQNVWNWPLGILNVALYTIVFYHDKLYATMGLQVVYILLAGYGWWHWLHGGANRGALLVSRVPTREAVILAIGFVGATAGLFTLLWRATDASLPLVDSALTAASLVAQYMMTRKYLEAWVLWMVVDVAYVVTFVHQRLWPTAGLYLVFCGLAVVGWREWRDSLRRRAAGEAVYA